jgi:hypothetical protein
VLFVSEVARNHTAFHTNLMMLDLVEKGVSISTGTSFRYTLRNVLWQPQIIDSVLKLRALEQREIVLNNQRRSLDDLFDFKRDGNWLTREQMNRIRNAKNENRERNREFGEIDLDRQSEFSKIGTAKIGMDDRKNPKLSSKGGESTQPGGLAPMSHTGSAFGSAYDLEGSGEYRGVRGGSAFTKPSSPMTVVRRKEATLLIRWLEYALKATGGFDAVSLVDDPNLNTSGIYDFVENSFNTTDTSFTKVLELIQKRVDSFALML